MESKPAAIVYLPGLGEAHNDQSADAIANKIRRGLELGGAELGYEDFDFERLAAFVYDEHAEKEAQASRIVGVSDGDRQTLFDLYRLEYRPKLVRDFDRRNRLGKALMLFGVLILCGMRLGNTWRRASCQGRDKRFQFFLGLVLASVLAVAATGLVVAAFYEAGGAASHVMGSDAASTPDPAVEPPPATSPPEDGLLAEGQGPGWWRSMWQLALFVFGAFGVSRVALGKHVVDFSALSYGAIRYVSAGTNRRNVQEEVRRLLSELVETEQYSAIHVIGYSFGSVVAVDAIYPKDPDHADGLPFASLTTIGCPFDLIDVYWPRYFSKRVTLESTPRWLNVYTDADVFASDMSRHPLGEAAGAETRAYGDGPRPFALVQEEDEVDEPVVVDSRSYGSDARTGLQRLVAMLFLNGISAHSHYWSDDKDNTGCWELVVRHALLDGMPVPSAPATPPPTPAVPPEASVT